MIHLNMTAEIDVCVNDKWETSRRAWVENQIMRKIVNAVGDIFEYPISARVELQELNIQGDGSEEI